MRDRDVFQLAYLPHLIATHFETLAIYLEAREAAEGELATRAEAMAAALQRRGPEVVSCVWQLARVLRAHGLTPPPEPRTGDDVGKLFEVTRAALPASPLAEHAARCGLAERALELAVRLAPLWRAAPAHPRLVARAAASREALARLAEAAPEAACPTMRREAAVITEAANAAALDAPPALDGALEAARDRVSAAARALEAAADGTPRAAIAAWFAKRLTGPTLMRQIVEHPRWRVPVRAGVPATITRDGTTVLFVFSDDDALAARPSFVDVETVQVVPGPALMHELPDGVQVLVLDATPEEAATLNYQQHQFARLKEVAREVAFEVAATNWSRLDLDVLRTQQFWVLVGGGSLRTFAADDGYGRTLPAVYATPEALDAHLASATEEQRAKLAADQRYLLPGHALFSTLVQGAAGFVLNPVGPGRSRAFNRRTLEALAGPAQVGPSSATSET